VREKSEIQRNIQLQAATIPASNPFFVSVGDEIQYVYGLVLLLCFVGSVLVLGISNAALGLPMNCLDCLRIASVFFTVRIFSRHLQVGSSPLPVSKVTVTWQPDIHMARWFSAFGNVGLPLPSRRVLSFQMTSQKKCFSTIMILREELLIRSMPLQPIPLVWFQVLT
jgi:hypothetical protein